jgi:hypothetical protein
MMRKVPKSKCGLPGTNQELTISFGEQLNEAVLIERIINALRNAMQGPQFFLIRQQYFFPVFIRNL